MIELPATTTGFGLVLSSLYPAINIAPTAPIAAASVGVAMPPRIEPRTAMTKTIGGRKAANTGFKSKVSSESVVGGQDEGNNIAIVT